MAVAEEFEGMNITDAREAIVQKLDKKGLLVKIDEKYEHSVPCCYKCNKEIEPQIREQWFVSTKPLAEKAVAAVAKLKAGATTEDLVRDALRMLNS